MSGEVFTDQNSAHTIEKYDQEQRFASVEEINRIRELCSAKGLNLPRKKDDNPFEAFVFWALPNKDYTQEQFLNDYDALRNLSIDTKWPYGYTISDSVKEKYWKGSMCNTFTITTDMVKRYIHGYYMDPLNRYAVQLAISIQGYKPRISSGPLNCLELDIATVIKDYNNKTRGELIEMHQNCQIYLAYGPVQ